MPHAPQWTLVKLERACRKAFTERGRLKMKPLHNAAEVEWTDNGLIHAKIDPLVISHIAGVVHEVSHIVLEKELACFAEYWKNPSTGRIEEDLGEIAMNAWEEALLKHISSHRGRRAWWRNAIRSKLTK
jgi:hypothetical protein